MTPQTIKTVEFEKPNVADANSAAGGSCVAMHGPRCRRR